MSDEVVASVPAPSAPRTGPAWKWKKINEVAAEIGTTGQTIRNAINKAASFAAELVPALEKKASGVDFLVQPGAAYEHLRKYASPQLAARLVAPRGYEVAPVPSIVPGASAVEHFGGDKNLDDLYLGLTRTIEDAGIQPAVRNSMVVALAELRKRQESIEKAARLISEEDHIAKLRAVGQVWASAWEELAGAVTKAVHEQFAVETGMRLEDQHIGSMDLMRAAYCAAGNDIVIPRIKKHVEDEIDGLREVFE